MMDFHQARTLSEINMIAEAMLGKLTPRPTHDLFLKVSVATDSPEYLASSLAKRLECSPHVLSASLDGWDELSYPDLTDGETSG